VLLAYETKNSSFISRQKIINQHILTTLLTKCKNGSQVIDLKQKFPSILHIQTKNKDLPINLIARDSKNVDDYFKRVQSFLFQGIEDNVCGRRGCGGLMHKNAHGVSPISSLNTNVHRGRLSRDQLIQLIQKISFRDSQKNDDERKINSDDKEGTSLEPPHVPPLHAALDIGCPAYIINLIVQFYCNEDSFNLQYNGRTPLQIAATSASASVETFLMLLRRNPKMASRKYSDNESVLNQTIKTGPGRDKGPHMNDVCFIGSIVEIFPESLLIKDEEYDMHPFLLAAHTNWSIGFVFGLLRTNPCVVETYIPRPPCSS